MADKEDLRELVRNAPLRDRMLIVERLSRPLRAALRKTDTWATKDGRTLALENIEPSHRANLLAFLQRRAAFAKQGVEAEYVYGHEPHGEMALEDFHSELDHIAWQSPEEWLSDQPLYKRLVSLEEERVGRHE